MLSRSRRRKSTGSMISRYWLLSFVVVAVIVFATINCSGDDTAVTEKLFQAEEMTGLDHTVTAMESGGPAVLKPGEGGAPLTSDLWADLSGTYPAGQSIAARTALISMEVKDADLLDVLSMLAMRLGVNIIYLEEPVITTRQTKAEPRIITLKTEALSPLTTFQTVLQAEQLDYLVLGRNYIVGKQERLYEDFRYRMYLTKRNLHYVSAVAMEGYILELGIDLHSLVVDANQKALWLQGTPMALSKANEIIEMLDIRENADLVLGEQLMARYNLVYISAQAMEGYLSTMGIPVITLTVENNAHTIWVQGTPAALEKTKALIHIIDIAENYDPEVETPLMARFDLNYINAEPMKRYLIQALKMESDAIITVSANPSTLWVQGTPLELSKAADLIAILDIAENYDPEVPAPDQWHIIGSWSGEGIMSTETFITQTSEWRVNWRTYSETAGGTGMLQIFVYDENGNYIDTVANVQGVTQGSSFVRTPPGRYYLQISASNVKWEVSVDERKTGDPVDPIDGVVPLLARFNLRHVNADTMADLINSFASEMGITVDIRTVETNQKAIWIKVSPDDLVRVGDLVAMLDVAENAALGEFEMPLAGFQLVYISAGAMERYITEMGIDVQSLTIDENRRMIWIKGTLSAMEKVRELIDTLDTRANADLPLDEHPLTRIDLEHVSAGAMHAFLSQLDIPLNALVIDENQKILWLQGTPTTIDQAKALIAMLDIKENADLAADESPLTRIDLSYVSATAMESYLEALDLGIQIITVDVNEQILWIKGTPPAISEASKYIEMLDISDNADLPDGEGLITRIKLTYISVDVMISYLDDLDIAVTVLSQDAERKLFWVTGTPSALAEVRDLVDRLDTEDNAEIPGESLEQINLTYVSATLVETYLNNLNIPVQIVTIDTNLQTLWLSGSAADLARARELIARIDIIDNADLTAGEPVLSSFSMRYVTAQVMEEKLEEMQLPVESIITVDGNSQTIWIKATTLALTKAVEVISKLDIFESGAFGEGGTRILRMPVASSTGEHSLDDLHGLLELLSVLLDGQLILRSDLISGRWDYPPSNPLMDWNDPLIRQNEIRMSVSGDFAGAGRPAVRYLIAEGTMDNISLVEEMIEEIDNMKDSPFTFTIVEIEDEEENGEDTNNNNDNNNEGNNSNNNDNNDNDPQGGATNQSYTPPPPTQYHFLALNAVPAYGGSISGSGSYARGSWVTVTATPGEGYKFVRWIDRGAEVSTSRSYSFTIYADKKLEAVFIKEVSSVIVVPDSDDPGGEGEDD